MHDWPQRKARAYSSKSVSASSEVTAGPGINDNGSGSAALLEVALTVAAQDEFVAPSTRFVAEPC